jgi:PAS domain S-box-containing protein
MTTASDDDERTRRAVERALAEERERLRITLASIGDAVISTDVDGRVTFLNRVAEGLTGWTQTDAAGRPLTEVFHIVDEYSRRPADNPALRALQAGVVVGLANHTMLVARDGSERPIDDSAAPIRGETGAPIGAVLVFRDVSERKQSEEMRARLAAIVESSHDAIVSKTLDGTIRTWNSGAQRVFGYSPEEAIGRSITLIIPPERLAEEAAILERLVRGERIDSFETVRVTRDGRRLDISLTVSPLRDRDGHIIGASKIARDVTERKRAADALRASEARQRFLAELAAATQPLVDPGDVLAVTARMLAEHLGVDRCAYAEVEDQAVYHITGEHLRGAPSILGRWPVAGFGAEHLRSMLANAAWVVDDVDTDPRVGDDRRAYRATRIQAVVCVPLHKDGALTAAMAVHQSHARRWSDDEVALVRTVVDRCWEALERARVARRLADSRARVDYAVRLSGVGFWYCDLPFDVLSWDPRVKRHFWLPDDARVTIDTFYARIHPDDREPTRRAIEASIASDIPYDIDYRTVDPATGAIKWIRALGGTGRAADGTPVRFDGVTVDVTARKRDEQRLARALEREREQGRLLRRVADASLAIHSAGAPEAVLRVVAEEARRILDAELACTSLTASDDFAQSLAAVDPKDAAPAVGDVAGVCRTNRALRLARDELDARGLPPGDRPRRGWLAAPFVGRGGRNLGLIQVFDRRDGPFTDSDEAVLVQLAHIASVALENARLYAALREQDRRKDEFLALLAHELRNPLAPIRNGLQVMRLSEDLAVRERSQQIMDRQLGHMVRLIDDLLDVSRISRNKMELRRAPVELADVIASAVETARPPIDAAGHHLELALPPGPVVLDADLTRLAQVFSNLLTNSAKYTPPRGHIRLTAERRGDEVVVAVRDDGIGIPADALPTIFDMFSQVDGSLERSRGGLGIGLALVKGLVEMHGGTVVAESDGPGRGSTFTVRLPAGAGRPRPAPAPGPRDPPPGRRILAVDDNQDVAVTMATMLELLGHDVRVAHDGVEAVALAEEFRPELVLMDVGMPRLNGYDATRRIRAQPWGAGITVVALTGWGQEDDRARSRAAGCDGHLVKPVSLPDLEQLIAGLPERA